MCLGNTLVHETFDCCSSLGLLNVKLIVGFLKKFFLLLNMRYMREKKTQFTLIVCVRFSKFTNNTTVPFAYYKTNTERYAAIAADSTYSYSIEKSLSVCFIMKIKTLI